MLKKTVTVVTTKKPTAALGLVARPSPAKSRRRGAASTLAPSQPKPRRAKAKISAEDTPTLLIDDRAGSKDLLDHSPIDEVGHLCRLDSADCCFAGHGPSGNVLVGVELKSIFDLVSSMNTGRIQATQIPAMLDHYDVAWLLYYGFYRPGPHGELQIFRAGKWQSHSIGDRVVPYGWLQKFLFTVTAAGIHVGRVVDMEEAAQWIACLSRWWNKPWSEHRSLHAFDKSQHIQPTASLRPDIPDALLRKARFAAQLPGIGYGRALDVARHFPSITAMVLATEKEWQAVPGIGKTIAVAVRQVLDEE